MQSQKRTLPHAAPAAKQAKSAVTQREVARTKPVEIDAQALRHVAGGNTDLPRKYW